MSAAAALGRIRLIDGLILAAVALLALKVIGAFAPGLEADGKPAFARVLSKARTNYEPVDPTTTGSVPEKKAPPAAPEPASAPIPPPATPASPSEKAILERLGERRDELQQRAREMETRQRMLDEAERRVESRVDELRSQDAKRQAGASDSRTAEASGFKNLATMYETMKPKEAARVFERLPHDVLIPVVRQTSPRKMAEILAAMSPETAEKLTVALARGSAVAERPPAPGLPPGELQAIELPKTPPRP